ncbi:CpaF family protein [Candidatus Micrarchaeota archaeon]|nr:CpaF family protein [Candidatus Micrarchaeota archaeon]
MDFGWKIDREIGSDYYLPQNFSLTLEDRGICSLLLEKYSKFAGADGPMESTLHGLLKEICIDMGILMLKDRAQQIERAAIASLEFGAIGFLLLDENLEEIAHSRIGERIRVYRRGCGWLDTNACITSRDFAIGLINKLARPSGRRISHANPMINAQIENGSRMHASISLMDEAQVEITIRNFPKKPLGLIDLEKNGMISNDAANFLEKISKTDASILFCGNTGSGKTTLLNAFFSHVPLEDRVIAIEETQEIAIPHPHAIRLVAGSGGLGMKELSENTLRMRPDRLIIGEVRTDNELKALFLSMEAGQARGCYATFHAKSAREAINRILSMGILETDIESLDLLIVCKRMPEIRDGKMAERRGVLEICEIDGGIPFKIFELDENSNELAMNFKNYQKSKIRGKIEALFGK